MGLRIMRARMGILKRLALKLSARDSVIVMVAFSGFVACTAPSEAGSNKKKSCVDNPNYTQAVELLHLAHTELEKGNAREAYSVSSKGIEVIGDSYFNEEALDDTGMNNALADGSFERGDIADAASLKIQVLDSRVQSYRERLCSDQK